MREANPFGLTSRIIFGVFCNGPFSAGSAAVAAQIGKAGFWRAGLGRPVDRNEPKLHGEALLPLEVVYQAPMEVTLDRQAVGPGRLCHF